MPDTGVATQVELEVSTPSRISVTPRTRLFGLLVLLAASFVPSLINSTTAFLATQSAGAGSDLGYLRVLLKQVICLALFVYVLQRNGQTTNDVGFKISAADLAHAGLLIVASSLVFQLPRDLATYFYKIVLGHEPSAYRSTLTGTSLVIATVFAFVNPFFEELIVRVFLISEVIQLTSSTALAIALSVLLQTSYHLYQGVPNAVGHGFVFLMFSLYYVRKRRAWPIILAHMYTDVHAVVYYSQHLR